jgi:hypothetical protein
MNLSKVFSSYTARLFISIVEVQYQLEFRLIGFKVYKSLILAKVGILVNIGILDEEGFIID